MFRCCFDDCLLKMESISIFSLLRFQNRYTVRGWYEVVVQGWYVETEEWLMKTKKLKWGCDRGRCIVLCIVWCIDYCIEYRGWLQNQYTRESI